MRNNFPTFFIACSSFTFVEWMLLSSELIWAALPTLQKCRLESEDLAAQADRLA
jgi:hypothetical protein